MAVQITPERLQEKNACEYQRDLFAEHFPNGVEFESEADAVEMCVKFADLFDFSGAADKLLDADARTEFYRAKAPAGAEFDKTEAPAWAKFKKATAPARAEFKKVQALAFAKAYWHQETSK